MGNTYFVLPTNLNRFAQKRVDTKNLPTPNSPTNFVMQMHDELVLEVPLAGRELVRQQLPVLMNGVAKLAVPLLVELGDGLNWEKAR